MDRNFNSYDSRYHNDRTDHINHRHDTHIHHRHANGIGEGGYMLSKAVSFIAGLLETILLFRFVFLIVGANPSNTFVSFIYNLTEPFVAPFRGIISGFYGRGLETGSVFEPSTLLALIIYPLIAWGLIRLIQTISHGAHSRHEHVHSRF